MTMWVRMLALTCACAVSTTAMAEDGEYPAVEYPDLPATAASAEAFVPQGWRLEIAKHGDLNTDKQDDLMMVLQMQQASNIVQNDGLGMKEFDTNPRMLVVAFADGEGFRLALEDHALIPRPDSPVMDDYLEGDDAVTVRRGAFTVNLHSWASAGSWYTSDTTFTFRFQDGCFRLIGYDRAESHRASGETTTTSVNYAAGKATVGLSNFSSDAPPKTHAVAVKRSVLPCLQDIGNGFEFDPGVASGSEE
jgi:hypothetical protein